jgi:ATP-dependent Clp protease ATP-binding subunit ClpA
MLDPEASGLMLLASQERMKRKAPLGLEAMTQGMIGTADLLIVFLDRYPEPSKTFTSQLGIDVETLNSELRSIGDTQEPVPDLAKESRVLASMDIKPSFSAPLKNAMKASREQAREKQLDRAILEDFIKALLAQDCEARGAILRLTTAGELDQAIKDLHVEPNGSIDVASSMMASMPQMLDSLWPKLQEEQRTERIKRQGGDKVLEQKEKLYAENPDYYDKSLNLPERFAADVPDDRKYQQCCGACVHAAENEARMRHAPEVKLDHVLLAILQEGTATWKYLESKGINPRLWRQALDEQLPRYDDGPRWPPQARDLGMNIPDRGSRLIIKKDIPDDLDMAKLTPEQRKEYAERQPSGRRFTDVAWLVAMAKEKDAFAYRLLNEAGITEDELHAETEAQEQNDPNWYLQKPDLASQLKAIDSKGISAEFNMRHVIEDAARYEARKRWSPQIEFEHVLLALLADGTDTADFLDSMGIDRKEITQQLDSLLPRLEHKCFFPDHSTASRFLFWLTDENSELSDLLTIECALNPRTNMKLNENAGVNVLRQKGVTLPLIQDRLKELGVKQMQFDEPTS